MGYPDYGLLRLFSPDFEVRDRNSSIICISGGKSQKAVVAIDIRVGGMETVYLHMPVSKRL